MSDIAAIILAAGESRRFRAAAGPSGPISKLVARIEGEPLVRHAARSALASRARPVIAVTGHARTEVEAALSGLAIRFAHNPDYATGLASSLKAAIAALPQDIDGAVILLGDMPRVSAALIDRLIDALDANPAAKAIAPVHNGQRGNPVLIARELFPEIAKLDGDMGARPLLRAAGSDVVEIAVEDSAIAFDVDTPDALRG